MEKLAKTDTTQKIRMNIRSPLSGYQHLAQKQLAMR